MDKIDPMDYRQFRQRSDGSTYLEGDAHTRANTKWQKKKGLISKSYKLSAALVELYAEACEENEISQAKALTKHMRNYITRHHPDGREALEDI